MFFQKFVTNINDFTNLLAPKNLSKYSYFNPQKICKIVHYIHLLYRGTFMINIHLLISWGFFLYTRLKIVWYVFPLLVTPLLFLH